MFSAVVGSWKATLMTEEKSEIRAKAALHMKRILITGKNSYIGTYLSNYLSAFAQDYVVDELDLRTSDWVNASFENYDTIFHVAALVHQKRSHDPSISKAYTDVNCNLALRCAKKAKAEGVRQFLFISSMSIYGQIPKGTDCLTITKETPPHPTSDYGKSKLQAEEALLPLESCSFHVAILRPPMIYGPGCPGNYRQLSRIARILPVFPKVTNQRSMLYIENFCAYIRHLIDNNANGIHFPQNASYTNTSDMVYLIAKAHNKHLLLLPGFNGVIHCMARVLPLIGKVFGSLVYHQSLSHSGAPYQLYSLEDSIRLSEKDSC